ncbi:MAG: betaine/proline/choline family ABC transporter ATP-binding protein [Syntrophomonadaceae bacterium]|nr:betaine/proline/choline family ABC transporter ATP-binding protein [Syntrophomonadaceae bacterium]
MVIFKAVSKHYNGHIAVKNLNLNVKEGEFVTLIGPSGCGKTTTLKMVNRLVEPTEGDILINGRNIRDTDPVALRRQIGYVIQQIGLFPHMTVEENITVVPTLLEWPATKRRARGHELLDMAGMDPVIYANRYPSELSGGQQQRIGVLRALAADPPLILMDEPFGALDPISREVLQDELKSLQKRLHKTIIFVTHDMDEALKLADRVVVMREGEVIQEATPEELLRKPADDFVASFVGKSRRNDSKLLIVEQVMQPNPVTVLPSVGLAQCLTLMKRKRVDTVLVVDEEGVLIGGVSIETLDREHQRAYRIGEIADHNLVTVLNSTPAKDAFDLMVGDQLKYLPVVDEHRHLRGLVTRTSMVNAMASVVWGDEND